MPGVCPLGGDGGRMLKFRVDGRITETDHATKEPG